MLIGQKCEFFGLDVVAGWPHIGDVGQLGAREDERHVQVVR